MLVIRASSLLLLDLVWSVSCNVIYNKSVELREKLLENYEKDDMPSFLQAMPITVAVSFQMTALRDMNELEGEMVTVGYLSLTWLDPRLTWNPMDYAGITYLILRSDKVCLELDLQICCSVILTQKQNIAIAQAMSPLRKPYFPYDACKM